MIMRWILASLWLLACVAGASTTAGWKMPIDAVVRGEKVDEVLPKLEKPPGESEFFQPGDVLRDLKPLLESRVGRVQLAREADASADGNPFEVKRSAVPGGAGPWNGDWVVWNERSGMIVAQGSYNDLFLVEATLGFLDLPQIIQARLELVCADPERSRSVMVSAGSGFNAAAKAQDFEAEVELVSFEDKVAMRLSPSWSVSEGEARWSLQTALTLETGKRRLVAGHGTGARRWELFATATVEHLGGVPLMEARWIERNGRVEAWPRVAANDGVFRERLADGQAACLVDAPFSAIAIWIGSGGVRLGPYPAIAAPSSVTRWMRGEVADVRGLLASGNEGKLSFAGFDSRTGRAMLVGDAAAIDIAEMMLEPGITDPPPPEYWIESNEAAGGWLLACRSGEKASLALVRGEEQEASFEVEPTTGSPLVDLRFAIDIVPDDKVLGHVLSSTTLMVGHPQTVGGYTPAGGGEERKLTLTVRPTPP